MARAADLSHTQVREALRAFGVADPPTHRGAALRALREAFGAYEAVRSVVDQAPEDARAAFVELAHGGPAAVEDLLGRGWWGHGTLPPPLDWLQHRGLVAVGDDGLVRAVEEAAAAFRERTLPLPDAPASGSPAPAPGARASVPDRGAGVGEPDRAADDTVRVEEAGCVLVAAQAAVLDRALTVTGAALRAVSPTVAVSPKSAGQVGTALRAAGLRLTGDAVVAASPSEPALPDTPEEATGPRAVRSLLDRAVTEQRQVWLQYFASSRGGAATERVVCPWAFDEDLLVGHCHLRRGERTFAVDRIGRARLLPSPLDHPAPSG